MAAIPEFVLRKLYVSGSYQAGPDQFSFILENSFAPATIFSFQLEVPSQGVNQDCILIHNSDSKESRVDQTIPASWLVVLSYSMG